MDALNLLPGEPAMSYHHHLSIAVIGAVALTGWAGSAYADKLGDFKHAANRDNCTAIPYKQERDRCHDHVRDADGSCSDTGCNAFRTKALLAKIKKAVRERDRLKRAGAKKHAARIDELNRQIVNDRARVAERKAECGRRIDRGLRCVASRNKARKVVGTAQTKVAAEKDKRLARYREIILNKLAAYSRQLKARNKPTNQRLRQCRAAKAGTW